jgi:predicted nucleotidyltransferase component of viral defense system
LFGEVDVESDRLIEELKTIGDLKIVKDSKNIRIYLINNVKVDIVNYNYSWLKDVININHIRLASPEDICAMKLAAVTGRGTKKDFIDIYYLLQSFSLEQMLSFYAQKYPEGYEFTVLKSLSYFEDAEREPMPYMLQKIDWETIKKSIESTIQFSFS